MKKSFKIFVVVLFFSVTMLFTKFMQSCSKEQSEEIPKSKNETVSLFKIEDSMVVGEVINGECVITTDEEELLLYFSKLADDQGLGEVIFDNIRIVKKELLHDDGKTEFYYGLYASDKDFKYNSAVSLILDGSFFRLEGSGGGTITCQSVGCGTGCAPYKKKIDGGSIWTCSECSNSCTKTMTVSLP